MLYLHIPFCHHKCTYCGFYSVAGSRYRDAYVGALCDELRMRSSQQQLKTVYFGGGTPSILSLQQLQRIVDTIRDNYDTSALQEVTLEANPENLTPSYLDGLAAMRFVNRLSIGIQSFRDDELHRINRAHSAQQVREAIHNAAASGFENVSIDLIMGLPGQTCDDFQTNLDALASLPDVEVVKHLSCYELTVEEGSILERQLRMGRLALPAEQTLVEEYGKLYDWCEVHGFEQYEVSNFCRPGYASRHNSGYWMRTPYLGVGAAAHSFDGTCRRWNVADIQRYVDGTAQGMVPFEEEQLSERDAYNEYLMTALRTVDGIDLERVPPSLRERLAMAVKPFVRQGLLTQTPQGYKPTRQGLLHADGMAATLFVV